MEPAMRFLEKVLTFVVNIMTSGNELLVLAGATLFFVLGLILFYKKGPWLGIPVSLAGILVIVMAIIVKSLSL
jgi:hypothetical protein